MKEIWKPIKHYEHLYEVSTLGRVRCLQTRSWQWNQHPKTERAGDILPQRDNGNGYQKVTLYGDGDCHHRKVKSRGEYVHRLVAMTFIPNPDNKPQVDHIDCCRSNNEVTNLRWVTESENNMNPITNQRMRDAWTDDYRQKRKDLGIAMGERNGRNTKPESFTTENNAFHILYKGTHYYNNGVEENRFHEGQQPEGWVKGRLPGCFGRNI